MKFTEVSLIPEIQRAVADMGYKSLTPVQEQSMPHVLANRDVLALAETGSGKTSACGIPLVQKIDPSNRNIQGLILVPTRELALQYVDEIDCIARYTDISPFAIFGGFDMDIQRAKLNDGVHILVATPGRLIDHLRNWGLSLYSVSTLVLDEADEMLNMGFFDDIKFIMSCIVCEHQTLLFSATMPQEIEELAASCMKEPVKVKLNRENRAPQSLSHHFRFLRYRERSTFIIEYLGSQDVKQAIVFCNSRANGDRLYGELKRARISVDYLHGGLDQPRRTAIYNKVKKCEIKVLLATDVAARGLDFSHVTHVINYDFPSNAETYINRTGRTGRMGRVGTAITFVTRRDIEAMKKLISDNHIVPVWDGEPPDIDSIRQRPKLQEKGKKWKKLPRKALRKSGLAVWRRPRNG
ncbi:MAG: DEAD/DEAH box helicase [Chloroflexota bacterium]|nr:DEAD/DEAH box helicase [Chloroflexota bacterium]